MQYNRKNIGAMFIAGFVIAIFVIIGITGNSAKAENKTVRVGFFPMQGFNEYNNEGVPQGYDVDILNEISMYTDWSYEYIRKESKEEAIDALKNGEVDIVGAMQSSTEYMKEFEFSAYPSGTTYWALMTLIGNESVLYEDFESMRELKFGYVGECPVDELESYIGFLPDMVFFESHEKMRDALSASEIDIIAADVMNKNDKEKIVGKFAPVSFYYAVNKNRVDLLEELNDAIGDISINSPELISSLDAQYYGFKPLTDFTKEEIEFINSSDVISVGIPSTREPVNWLDESTNEMTGIVPAVLDLISQNSGLKFEYVAIEGGSAPVPNLKLGKWDMVGGIVYSEGNRNDSEIKVSFPFIKGTLALFGRKGEEFSADKPLTIAIRSGFEAGIQYAQKNFPNFTVVEYNGNRECLEAVKNKEADVLFQNSYVIDKYLKGPTYEGIEVIPTINEEEMLCMAALTDSDPRLMSVINKTIKNLPLEDINQCIINYTVAKPYQITVSDFIAQYKRQLILTAVLLLLICAAIAIAVKQKKKNANLIKENERILASITDNVNGGVIMLLPDTGFTITYANKGFLDLIGYTREEYENKKHNKGITYVHKDDIHLLNEAVSSKHTGEKIELEMRILQKGNRYVPVLFRGTLSYGVSGVPLLFCVVTNITEEKRIQEELEIEQERYRVIVEQSEEIIFDVDVDKNKVMSGMQFKDKFGWDFNISLQDLEIVIKMRVHPYDEVLIRKIMAAVKEGKINAEDRVRIQKLNGEYIWCDIQLSRISKIGRAVRLVGKIKDVNDIVIERKRLEGLSQIDQLTGLYNKAAFRSAIDKFNSEKGEKNKKAALFFTDLDNFKTINDKLGHLEGDRVLQKTAQTLKGIFREEDMIGRFGGDEFFVFVKNASREVLESRAKTLCEQLKFEYNQEGVVIKSSGSLGIYEFYAGDASCDEILNRADKALYYVKNNKKGTYKFYNDI